MATTAAASGTLITKTHRHDATPSSPPPTNGASAPATPLNAAQAPTALALSVAAKLDWMMARLAGVTSAPPMPCSVRAAISAWMPGASAQSTEAAVNHTEPMTKTRRRPNRSPAAPPSRISDASVTV